MKSDTDDLEVEHGLRGALAKIGDAAKEGAKNTGRALTGKEAVTDLTGSDALSGASGPDKERGTGPSKFSSLEELASKTRLDVWI